MRGETQGERTSRTDWAKEKERKTESSRRCDALPRAEVIDRGCNGEWRGNKTSTGLWGEKRRRGRERERGVVEGMEKGRKGGGMHRERGEGEANASIDCWRGLHAVASTGSAVHPHPLASHRRRSAAGTLLSAGWTLAPLTVHRSLFSIPPRSSSPVRLPPRHFSWRSPLSLSSWVSRPSRPGPRATTESTTSASRGDAVCAAPVNVTLKTEGVHVHTYSDGCAVRKRAFARGAILYIRARDGRWLIRTLNARTRISLEYLARCEMLNMLEFINHEGEHVQNYIFLFTFRIFQNTNIPIFIVNICCLYFHIYKRSYITCKSSNNITI